ncbi:membrane protein implicated in regulation of membrane protease activity [Mycobacterium xenopi 3993]|nr:membrane protein implicated in regulation of membrane protease activity [Mycobacterium xenopi 3993]
MWLIARYPDRMPAALLWLIFALGLAGAEALTGDMFLLMLGGGRWLRPQPVGCWTGRRGPTGGVPGGLGSAAGCGPARGTAAADPAKEIATGVQALEGKSALVLDRVARHEGQIKLDGQVWTARPFNEADVYEPGELVTVMRIDGATAVVWKNV